MHKFQTLKILQLVVFIFALICLFNLPILAQKNAPDKVKAVKTVKGKFIRFEVGDYYHVDIKRSNGKTESYWLGGRGLEYFLAVNRNKTMTFIYEVVDTYIEQNGGRMVIERLKSAKIGNLTFEKWWKDLRKRYTIEQIRKKYEPLVDKYTKN